MVERKGWTAFLEHLYETDPEGRRPLPPNMPQRTENHPNFKQEYENWARDFDLRHADTESSSEEEEDEGDEEDLRAMRAHTQQVQELMHDMPWIKNVLGEKTRQAVDPTRSIDSDQSTEEGATSAASAWPNQEKIEGAQMDMKAETFAEDLEERQQFMDEQQQFLDEHNERGAEDPQALDPPLETLETLRDASKLFGQLIATNPHRPYRAEADWTEFPEEASSSSHMQAEAKAEMKAEVAAKGEEPPEEPFDEDMELHDEKPHDMEQSLVTDAYTPVPEEEGDSTFQSLNEAVGRACFNSLLADIAEMQAEMKAEMQAKPKTEANDTQPKKEASDKIKHSPITAKQPGRRRKTSNKIPKPAAPTPPNHSPPRGTCRFLLPHQPEVPPPRSLIKPGHENYIGTRRSLFPCVTQMTLGVTMVTTALPYQPPFLAIVCWSPRMGFFIFFQ